MNCRWLPVRLHQLRTTLDHLVAAIFDGRGIQRPWLSGFPIFADPGTYRKKHARHIRGLPADAAAEIEQWQPFVRDPRKPQFDPLWILHEQQNKDKHHVVAVVAATTRSIDIRITGGATSATRTGVEGLKTLVDGQRLMAFASGPGVTVEETILPVQLSLDNVEGRPHKQPLAAFLSEVAGDVERIVAQLGRHIP